MKIALITLPFHTNYGGILQAWALRSVLIGMGHEVTHLERTPPAVRMPLLVWRCLRRIASRWLLGRRQLIFVEHKFMRERAATRVYTDRFIHTHLSVRYFSSFSEVKSSDYDAFVVGSDQVWRPLYMGLDSILDAFLAFTGDWKVRRYAYAASFGTDNWEYDSELTARCAELVSRFDTVSVREQAALSLCQDHLNTKACTVPDPTLLLTAADYRRLISLNPPPSPDGDLFVYVLDETPRASTLIRRLVSDLGLSPFRVNSRVADVTAPLAERIHPPVESWVDAFDKARFVLTDSFHACVFALIFEKPFLVTGNALRGDSRFHSLLSRYGLLDRLVADPENLNFETLPQIDWSHIREIRESDRSIGNSLLSEWFS